MGVTHFIILAFLHSTFLSTTVSAQKAVEKPKSAKSDSVAAADTTGISYDYSRPQPVYDSLGKRDPFESLVPKEVDKAEAIKDVFNYEGGTLRGIAKNTTEAYAFVVDAGGFGYVLREGSRVFGGYVTSITDDALTMHIVKYGRSLSIIMRLESSKHIVIEEPEPSESVMKKPGINISYNKAIKDTARISVEDVLVPSVDVKTVEEEWFGTHDGIKPAEENPPQPEKEPPIAFTLFNPPNNSWITLPYLLDWTQYGGKTTIYSVVIDDNPDYSTPLLIQKNISVTSFLLTENVDLPFNTLLYWKVIAQDESGQQVQSRRIDMSFRIKEH